MKKKIGKYLILGIVFVFLLGASIYYFNTLSGENNHLDNFNQNEDNHSDNNEKDTDNDDESDNNSSDDSSINSEINYFKELGVNDFVSLIDNKEDFVLVISQTWCGHCTNYKPKVEEVSNNNKVIIYYIEYNMLSENEKNIFNGYVEFLGTPTTVFFKDGTELVDAKIEGDTTSKKIESILKDNGYIN